MNTRRLHLLNHLFLSRQFIKRIVILAMCLLLIYPSMPVNGQTAQGQAVADEASRHIGREITDFGSAFFVHYVYDQIGIAVPQRLGALSREGTFIRQGENLLIGDIVFFGTDANNLTAAGIYVGNDDFIVAHPPYNNIRKMSLKSDVAQRNYLGARRIIDADAEAGPAMEEETNRAEIIRGVNFRRGPSTDSEVIRMLRRGTYVTVLEQVNQHWLRVEANGEEGFVSASPRFVQILTPEAETDAGQEATPETTPDAPEAPEEPTPEEPADQQAVLRQTIIDEGMKFLGVPYEFGANRNSIATMDCSDFVRRTYIDATGIVLPTNSRSQAQFVQNNGRVTRNWRDLQPGDLMFFISPQNQRIYHVGLYKGDGQLLHTYSVASGGVRVDRIPGTFWERQFYFGGSIID